MISQKKSEIKKIDNIEESDDFLTGRGGLAIIDRYMSNIPWLSDLLKSMDFLKRNRNGIPVSDIIYQMIINFIDGTSPHLSYFDDLKEDPTYAALLGKEQELLAGTSVIKRMLKKCSFSRKRGFKHFYERFFIWRMKVEEAPYIKIDVDTVVFENSTSTIRKGVSWTYKKVNGFQPLLFKWNGYIIDAIFREGKCHSNYGDDTLAGLRRVVEIIRKKYRRDIPILVTLDGGFFDQKIFKLCEDELKIGYIAGGKMYKDIIKRVNLIPDDEYNIYRKSNSIREWMYTEFADKRDSWDVDRRAIFTTLYSESNQLVIKGTGIASIVYTNLGMNQEIDLQLENAGVDYLIETENIIMLAHNRGEDELVHRHVKDFAGTENLPCLDFEMNEAYFSIMLFSFNMQQSFKRDCCETVIGKDTYPKTFRRKLIDFAGKIVKHARKTTMKVGAIAKKQLQLEIVWELAGSVP